MLIFLKEKANETYGVIAPNFDEDKPSVGSSVMVMG